MSIIPFPAACRNCGTRNRISKVTRVEKRWMRPDITHIMEICEVCGTLQKPAYELAPPAPEPAHVP